MYIYIIYIIQSAYTYILIVHCSVSNCAYVFAHIFEVSFS